MANGNGFFWFSTIQRPDTLQRCYNYAQKLQAKSSSNLRTQVLTFEVYLRVEKYLLALRSVKKAIELAGAEHPEVHAMIVKFFHTGTFCNPLPPPRRLGFVCGLMNICFFLAQFPASS
jgi:peptide alpha-N-acetyltransferase